MGLQGEAASRGLEEDSGGLQGLRRALKGASR